jgi:hypothetical protein
MVVGLYTQLIAAMVCSTEDHWSALRTVMLQGCLPRSQPQITHLVVDVVQFSDPALPPLSRVQTPVYKACELLETERT